MTTGILHDQNLEKQMEKHMGCMTGFLHIFDRHQIINGKRLNTTKRLPAPSPIAIDSASDSDSDTTDVSPSISRELQKPSPMPSRLKQYHAPELRSPVTEFSTPAESPAKMPLPLPIFNFKEGTKTSWKFRESPRLSLDSRAIVDAKGSLYPREIRPNAGGDDDMEKQRRSPSVIARLMGLEQLPHSSAEPMMKKAELRRSASESRVPRDLRFIDCNQSHADNLRNVIKEDDRIESNVRSVDPTDYASRTMKSEASKATQRRVNVSQWKSPQQRKSFFDSADFFPEPKQTVSIYGEIEKRLRMRGIDEPSRDLETLKQILEALQLKGLLHSKQSLEEQLNFRNFVYDRNFSSDESPIVLMKPSRSSPIGQRRQGNDSPPSNFTSRSVPRRNPNFSGESLPAVNLRRDRNEIDRNARNSPRGRNSCSPSRSESSVTSSSSLVRRKPLTIETPKRGYGSVEQRRTSPVQSPKVALRKTSLTSPDHAQSLRNRKSTVEIQRKSKLPLKVEDESSSISESSISGSSSQTDSEKKKMGKGYKEGRTLLDRCDKLLHSIAEMNTSELQPSPISVLDSSFYKDDSSSPSPVMKRSIDFTEDQVVDFEDELWSPMISAVASKHDEYVDECDFLYISDILLASNYFPEDSDIFLLIEKQQYLKGKDTSKFSTLQRKLIFDTVTEILDRNKQFPSWKFNSSTLDQIWLEFRKIRERDDSEDLFEVIFGVLKKDLAGDAISGWKECHVETSEAVLDIERSIFKDLIGETIRDLADLAVKSKGPFLFRKKLVF